MANLLSDMNGAANPTGNPLIGEMNDVSSAPQANTGFTGTGQTGVAGAVSAFAAGGQNMASNALAKIANFAGASGLSNKIKSVNEEMQSANQQAIQGHPVANALGAGTVAGGIGTLISPALGGAAAGTAATVASGAATGAATMGLVNNQKQTGYTTGQAVLQGAVGGTLGAGVGVTIGKVLGSAADIYKGMQIAKADGNTLANAAISNTLAKPASTIGDFKNSLDAVKKVVGDQDTANYNAVRDLGDTFNLSVNRSSLQNYAKSLESEAATSSSPSLNNAITQLHNIIGNGKDVPINQAIDISKNLGNFAKQAGTTGDGVLQRYLMQAKNSFDDSISTSAAKSPVFNAAWQDAKDYHSNTVAPLNDTLLSAKIYGKYTDSEFLQKAVKGIQTQQAYGQAYAQLPQEAQQQLVGSYTNALKSATAVEGQFNLPKFADQWSAAARKNPTLFNQQQVGHIEAVSTALKSLGQGLKGATGQIAAGSAGEGSSQGIAASEAVNDIMDGEPISGMFKLLIPKARQGLLKVASLKALGAMSDNPDTAALLNGYNNLIKTNPKSPLVPLITNKIGMKFNSLHGVMLSKAFQATGLGTLAATNQNG